MITDNDILVLLKTSLDMVLEPWVLPPILEMGVYKVLSEDPNDTLFVLEIRTAHGSARVLRDRRDMVEIINQADGDPPLVIHEELVAQLGALRARE